MANQTTNNTDVFPTFIKEKEALLNQYFERGDVAQVENIAESIVLDLQEWKAETKLDKELSNAPYI